MGSSGDTQAAVKSINGQQCICGIATTEFRKCLASFKDTEYTAMLHKSKQTLNAIKKSSNDPAIIGALEEAHLTISVTEHMRIDIINRSSRLMNAYDALQRMIEQLVNLVK